MKINVETVKRLFGITCLFEALFTVITRFILLHVTTACYSGADFNFTNPLGYYNAGPGGTGICTTPFGFLEPHHLFYISFYILISSIVVYLLFKVTSLKNSRIMAEVRKRPVLFYAIYLTIVFALIFIAEFRFRTL